MQTEAYVITPDNKRVAVVLENGKRHLTLEQMQKAVGGYIQPLTINADTIMMVDEDGTSKRLEPNHAASELFGTMIVGNALVMPRKWLN